MKTSELTGAALDWMVAKCIGTDAETLDPITFVHTAHASGGWCFSTNWSQGGPIIERERLMVWPITGYVNENEKWACRLASLPVAVGSTQNGPTPLIATMRCYVASKLGDEVDVPDGL